MAETQGKAYIDGQLSKKMIHIKRFGLWTRKISDMAYLSRISSQGKHTLLSRIQCQDVGSFGCEIYGTLRTRCNMHIAIVTCSSSSRQKYSGSSFRLIYSVPINYQLDTSVVHFIAGVRYCFRMANPYASGIWGIGKTRELCYYIPVMNQIHNGYQFTNRWKDQGL